MDRATIGALAGGLIALLGAAAPARADVESILSFHSDVTVNADASLVVVETIRVHGEGRRIDHGIYRDFPTRARGFVNRFVPFDVVSVTRDGHPEPYTVERVLEGTRVRVGDPQVRLGRGEQTYVLTYRTARQIRHFTDRDELYWNVTGNAWEFQIDEASADVHLLAGAGARAGTPVGYTGQRGRQDHELTASRSPDGATYRTTRVLGRYEGLTIVLPWPKGFVREPTSADQRAWLLRDNWLLGVGALGAFAMFLLVRRRLAARPAPSAASDPVAEPPDGLSPAALRYVTRMAFDDGTFAAALMGLADRGHVTIGRDGDGKFRVSRGRGKRAELPDEERATLDALFSMGPSLRLESANAKTIAGARGALEASLKANYGGKYFFRDRRLLWPALGLAVGSFGALAASAPRPAAYVCLFLTVWLSGWTLGSASLVQNLVDTWRTAAARRRGYAGAVGTSIVLAFFFGFECFALFVYAMMASWAAAMILGTVLALVVIVGRRLQAPTALGATVRDKAKAYAAFLRGATAGGRETFARPLAYAVALGTMDAWAASLAQAGAVSLPTQPGWWSDGPWDSSAASDLSSSFSDALSSSSSSGSDGGSSGGGGGGGGGGGW